MQYLQICTHTTMLTCDCACVEHVHVYRPSSHNPYEPRYETTVGLPIEYGALNVGNVASGMLFYGEVHYPPPHDPAIHHICGERGHKHGIMNLRALWTLARPIGYDRRGHTHLVNPTRPGALHVGRPAVACARWRRPTARRHRRGSVAASLSAAPAAPVVLVEPDAELSFCRAQHFPLPCAKHASTASRVKPAPTAARARTRKSKCSIARSQENAECSYLHIY